MPCEYYSREQELAMRDAEIAQHVNKLTRMLCKCCDDLEGDGYSLDGEIGEWWIEHQKLDAIKLKVERKISKRRK